MIKIERDKRLESLKHAAPYEDAVYLRDIIKAFRKKGYELQYAYVRGYYVPNKYKYTFGMSAPGWKWYARNDHLVSVAFSLQCRPCGRGARFGICIRVPKGTKIDGWYCIRRTKMDGLDEIEVRK